MRKYLDKNTICNSLIKKLRKNKRNRFFVFEIEEGANENSFSLDLNSDIYICFNEQAIIFQLDMVDIFILYQQEKAMWSDQDIDDRVLLDINTDEISVEELINNICDVVLVFAGVADSHLIKRDKYKKDANLSYCWFDVFIKNYYSSTINNKIANISFHINQDRDMHKKKTVSKSTNAEMSTDLLNAKYYVEGLKSILRYEANDRDRFFARRYSCVDYTAEGNRIHYFNGIDGKSKYEISKHGVLFHCRGIKFFLRYNSEGNNFLPSDNVVEVYNHTLEELSAVEFHEEAARIRLLQTGAGDISYEERLDNEGKLTGYDIYEEKEYDESYIREYDNITFHVNDGYVHKTEQERLADYLVDNSDNIETVQDVVKLIMHPLQVTKASRFLCYRLENQETATPIIYFNGKEGDFYLKAYGDMLLLHCRDMAIIFNANETMLDDTIKSEMCIDEDDFVMFYKDEAFNNMVDIFRIAYEIIFILAGAGEVNHEMITAEHEENRYVISLEKEYIKPYSRSFGNISFDVREENY